MKTIIQTKSLAKRYKDITAVSNNNISISKGEIYGFLGLNGAGKTTTIRMLLGLVKPTSGKAFIKNREIKAGEKDIWNKVGYLVETPHAYSLLTVKENLELIAALRKISDKKAITNIIDLMELNEYAGRKAKHLSLGNRQRLGLAKALIHQPEILILDEPANGLDPAGIHDIRELFSGLAKEQGVTILISSHILGEIALFASRIGIIHKGKMLDEFETHKLNDRCRKELIIETNDLKTSARFLLQKGISTEIYNNRHLTITDKNVINKPEYLSKILVENGIDLKKLHIEEENLESYFLRIIKEKGGQK